MSSDVLWSLILRQQVSVKAIDTSPKYRLQEKSWHHWNEGPSSHRAQRGRSFPLQGVASYKPSSSGLGWHRQLPTQPHCWQQQSLPPCWISSWITHYWLWVCIWGLVMSMHIRINICIPDSIVAGWSFLQKGKDDHVDDHGITTSAKMIVILVKSAIKRLSKLCILLSVCATVAANSSSYE